MSQFPVGQGFQAAGTLLTAAKEYTLINWAGATLPTSVATLEEVRELRDKALELSKKLGLDAEQAALADLRIQQRDVLTIATNWGPFYE